MSSESTNIAKTKQKKTEERKGMRFTVFFRFPNRRKHTQTLIIS